MSEFVGSVGGRIRFEARIERVRFIKQNEYGPVFLIVLRDLRGNALSYFGNPLWLVYEYDERRDWFRFDNIGATVHLSATVKTHRTFRNQKETVLKRPRVIRADAPLLAVGL